MNTAGIIETYSMPLIKKKGKRGIALMMVLWVLAILSVIVMSFSYMTRTETFASLSFRNQITKKFIAEGGIERGVMEIFYRRQNLQAAVLEEGKEPWKMDGTPYKVDVENGSAVVMIMDESGKINLNNLNDTSGIIFKNLLMNSGVKEEVADTIVDSLLDWKDPDDLVRLHGAESDYYKSLPVPYKAKDGNLDSVEELLLVKGVTPEIVYGDGKKKGIIDFVTVFPKSAVQGNLSINLMSAPREVLAAIPGIGADDIEAIMTIREGQQKDPAAAAQEIQAFQAKIQPPFNSMVIRGEGTVFSIKSLGLLGTDKSGYGVIATVGMTQTSGAPVAAPVQAAAGQPATTLTNNKPPFTYLYYKSPAIVNYDSSGSN